MNKFQPLSFSSVTECLHHLPPEELAMVELLRELVLKELPGCREKLSFNVPFYHLQRAVCFIWPGSVPWGKTKPGVEFGLCQGHLLRNKEEYVHLGKRKRIAVRTFMNLTDIAPEKIRQLLQEAREVDLVFARKK